MPVRNFAFGLLVCALAAFLAGFLILDPSIAPLIPHSLSFFSAVIVVALVTLALLLSGTGRAVVQRVSITNYLASVGVLLCAAAWAWLTAHVLGFGTHFFGAALVAVPTLALIVTAANIIFMSLYNDLGLAPPARKKGKKKKKPPREAET